MSSQYAIVPYKVPAETIKQASTPIERTVQAQQHSQFFGQCLLHYLGPLVQHLKQENKVDKRPLKTLVQTVEAILTFRDRCNG